MERTRGRKGDGGRIKKEMLRERNKKKWVGKGMGGRAVILPFVP